jgi:hydrogenase/urease accessory protein HupE
VSIASAGLRLARSAAAAAVRLCLALPAAAAVLLCLALPAAAHRLAPSLLEVVETAPGELAVLWKTPLQQPAGSDLRPELPAGCRRVSEPEVGGDGSALTRRWRASCGAGGVVGRRFAVRGLREARSDALLRLELADGRRVQAVLGADAPEFEVPARQRPSDVARAYLALGARHILEGLDHLLFVLGLVLLLRGARPLLWTITAFTLGHSATLSLAALGAIALPSRPVELAIAASILVLAVELAEGERGRRSLLRRAPWAMAAAFGLLHGLGFAGALAEAGLPQEEVPLALCSFNLGIELGQLAFVLAVVCVRRALRPLAAAGPAWLARVPAYGIGTLAAYWICERSLALL